MAKTGPKQKIANFPKRSGPPGKAESGNPAGGVRSQRTEPLEPLKKLTKIQQHLWDEMIEPAWWLTQWDRPLCHMYIELQHEQLMKGKAMPTPRYRELRMLASELGLNTAEQARQGIRRPEDEDPTERFFD